MIKPNAVEKKRMTLPITNRLAAVTVNLIDGFLIRLWLIMLSGVM